MTLVILVQVFFRYVLNNSFPWSEELARYLMVWMTFLTLPVVSRLGQHAALEIILGSLPHKLNTILQLILYGLIGIVLFIAFDKSYDFAAKGMRMLATSLPGDESMVLCCNAGWIWCHDAGVFGTFFAESG